MDKDPSSTREIFSKNGQESTIFTVSVPDALRGLFLREPKLNSDQINVWIVKSESGDPLEKDLESALDGKIDETMAVGKPNVSFISKEELRQKLIEYGLKKMGIQENLKHKKTLEKVTAADAVKVDATAITSDILHDMDILKDQNRLPASFVLDFYTSNLQYGMNSTIRAVSQTFGPIVGQRKVLQNLKERMIDADILNERRLEKQSNNKPSQRLILIFA